MPRRYKKRSTRVKKVNALTKTGAKAQGKQIVKLQRQVDSIRRNVLDNTRYTQYSFPLAMSVAGDDDSTYSVWNLIQPSDWVPIFQTRPSEENDKTTPNKFRGRSISMEFMAQISGTTVSPIPSQDPITATVFIVSLRKETAQQFVTQTSNGLNLTEDVHYTQSNMGTLQGSGMIMLNKAYFKIRNVKRFMVGGNTSLYKDAVTGDPLGVTSNLRDNNRRWTVKLPYPNLLKDGGPNTREADEESGFKTLTLNEIEPMDQIFVYCFANSYGDQSLDIHSNIIINGTTSN